jgi:type II secretory pathway pseudopilin PulG
MRKIMRDERNSRGRSEAGFSLIELILSAAILLLLMAGVFSQVAKMQKFSNTEEKKRDMFQNVREALDQMNRDIHASGFPNKAQYNLTGTYTGAGSNPLPGYNSQTVLNSNQVANRGLVAALSNEVMFEGDVDGDGVVDSVAYLYCDPAAIVAPCTAPMVNNFKCPCLLRGQIQKVNGITPAGQPTLANMNVVLESLIAPGGTVETSIPPPVFLFYDSNGSVTNTLASIKTVKVSLYAQAVSDTTSVNEWKGKIRPQASMTLTAKINN